MSALWRRHGVQLLHEPAARAVHEGIPQADADDQESRIYANLFDALIASPAPLRAAAYELLGFAAGAKLYYRRPAEIVRFLRAWARGHRSLIRDWRELRALCESDATLEALSGGVGPVESNRAGHHRPRATQHPGRREFECG